MKNVLIDHLLFNPFPSIVSDRCSAGEAVDKSGELLRTLATTHLTECESLIGSIVPDDFDKIEVSSTLFIIHEHPTESLIESFSKIDRDASHD